MAKSCVCMLLLLKDGKSLLVRAAEWGNEMAVMKLLDDGADVDLKHKVMINSLMIIFIFLC